MNTSPASKPLLATFLTCVLLGPPVGALGLILAMSIRISNLTYDDLGRSLFTYLGTVLISSILIIPFSFLSGGLSAIFSGLAMVAYGWSKGEPPLWFAIAVALIASLVLVSVQNDTWHSGEIVMAHVLPAIVCWLVFRRYWNRWAKDGSVPTSLSGKTES
jgi:hypothetical protein